MPWTKPALDYHAAKPAGKLGISLTKPCVTQSDLSLAYSPGVAAASLAIREERSQVYRYTAKANLVAVVTNGTAVLGLGNIGPEAAKPVMEGKAMLLKRFADIDAFDIELAAPHVEDVVAACSMLEPTFGAINLEDIRAPECFEIERTLRRTLNIPVFHDDQHGTAIIVGAAVENALRVVGKAWDSVSVVINGAGASATACAEHLFRLGLRPLNLLMCDSSGVLYEGRQAGMNLHKQRFARPTSRRTLAEALNGADVFLGLSSGNSVPASALQGMEPKPIVFCLANPDPEIPYPLVRETRPDAVVGTGRSDYPNQINNLLGFPGIFRGALDTRAADINEDMMIAATHALAALTHTPVPSAVRALYPTEHLTFGPAYVIPKPFDPRVVIAVAVAVAGAAMRSGVARLPVSLDDYAAQLQQRFADAMPSVV